MEKIFEKLIRKFTLNEWSTVLILLLSVPEGSTSITTYVNIFMKKKFRLYDKKSLKTRHKSNQKRQTSETEDCTKHVHFAKFTLEIPKNFNCRTRGQPTCPHW